MNPILVTIARCLGIKHLCPLLDQDPEIQAFHEGNDITAEVVLAELGSTNAFCGARIHIEDTKVPVGAPYQSMAWDLMVEVRLPSEWDNTAEPLTFQLNNNALDTLIKQLIKAKQNLPRLDQALEAYAGNTYEAKQDIICLKKNSGELEAPIEE